MRLNTYQKNEHEKDGQGKHKTAYLVNIVILSIVTLAAVAFCFVLLFRTRALSGELERIYGELSMEEGGEKKLYTEAELQAQIDKTKSDAADAEKESLLNAVRTPLEEGQSTIAMLRSLFSDELVFLKDGRYYFAPVAEKVERNDYQEGDFAFDDGGVLQYVGAQRDVAARQGIDVSEENGYIDWNAVADDQISYAIIRLGSAGGEEGLSEDDYFAYNLENATDNGLQAGIYVEFSDVDSEDEAAAQAQAVVERLQAMEEERARITLPVAVAVRIPDEQSAHQSGAQNRNAAEDGQSQSGAQNRSAAGAAVDGQSQSGARTAQGEGDEPAQTAFQSAKTRTLHVAAFCDAIMEAGYTPMLYGDLASFAIYLDIGELEGYARWIADHSDSLYFPYRFSYWQYTDAGQVQGISGDVHRDIYLYRSAFQGEE